MATTIFRTAHSAVVRDAMDFSAALCGPSGETVAQAVTIPLQLGSIPSAMRALLARHGDELAEGDVFIGNDPFDGASHIPDVFVVKPSFAGGTLVGFAVTIAHHADLGGRVPGSCACDSTEVFQEGLRLPWLRLYRGGEPVEALFSIIRANVRIPHELLGDLSAQVAACNLGDRALRELAARHGSDRLAGLMARLLDHTESLLRREIAGWPDGTVTFTDYLDSDGIELCDVPITVDLTVQGDELVADFSRSAPMVRGALNCTPSFAQASVYHAVMAAATAEIPCTAGVARPVTVVTKPGTVTHVLMPNASSMRGMTGYRLSDVMNGALAQIIPERVPAAGEGGSTLAFFTGRVDGEPFVYGELVVGTWGGRPHRRRQRRPREPMREHREHPGRAGRERLADPDRALRPRRRQRRGGAIPGRARGRARLARARARRRGLRPLRPPRPPPLRARRRRRGRRLVEPDRPRRRDDRGDAPNVRGPAPARRRVPPPAAGRRRSRGPVRARSRRGRARRGRREGHPRRRPDAVRGRRRRRRGRPRRDRSRPQRRPGAVKITKIEATPLAIPLLQEFHWAGGAQRGANLVLFSVHTDEGVTGYGESVCEDQRAVVAYGELIGRQLIGRSPGDMEAILHSIFTEGRWKMFPQFTQLTFAGIEVACWDALGRALGVPSSTFFGGRVQEQLDYFGFLQGDDPETLAAHAKELAGAGFEVIYLKVGRGGARDEGCVAAVREAIGPDRLLRIDPNEAWDPATAVEMIRRLERYDLDWVEQPTAAGDVNGLAHVRRSVQPKIAADQSVFTTSQLVHVLEKEAADVVVQGSHDAGGLLRFRQQAFICSAFGLKVNRHAFMESELSFYANAQVAATIPNLTLGNQIMHQLLAERLTLGPPPELSGGKFRLNKAPGHGFELDHDAVGVAHERWQRDGAYNTVERLEAR